jgi:hypothetical protein
VRSKSSRAKEDEKMPKNNKPEFIWNLDGDRCVRTSQIREYDISRFYPFQVFAMFGKDDYITVHQDETLAASQEWLREQLKKEDQ